MGNFINSQSNINEVSKASAADSVSQSAGKEWPQNKIGDDDIDSRERAVVKHWLIQSLAGGSFTSLYPVRQTTREAESQFVGFTSCILPICICLCLFGLDWLELPEERYPFSKILCSICWIRKEDKTALFRKKGIWIMLTTFPYIWRRLCRHSSNVVNLQDPSTSEAVSGIGFRQFAARQPGSRWRMLNLLNPGTCWRVLNLLNPGTRWWMFNSLKLEAAEGC